MAELDGTGALVSRFVYATRANVPDFVVRGGNTYRVLADHLGSPRVVVNVADANDRPVVMGHDAFGNVGSGSLGADWLPFGFAGGLYDAETRLLRFGARDYDPNVGRWTAKDPIVFAGGDSNLYAYAGSDSVGRTDPTGKLPPIGEAECLAQCLGREPAEANQYFSDLTDPYCSGSDDFISRSICDVVQTCVRPLGRNVEEAWNEGSWPGVFGNVTWCTAYCYGTPVFE